MTIWFLRSAILITLTRDIQCEKFIEDEDSYVYLTNWTKDSKTSETVLRRQDTKNH